MRRPRVVGVATAFSQNGSLPLNANGYATLKLIMALVLKISQSSKGSATLHRLFWMSLLAGSLAMPELVRAADKPVLVHYMPWYVAKPYSSSWGWHWTMNHFNPDSIDGAGQRQIASHYYPRIGPYDSADPVVLEYHVLLMKLAGIDGVIVDWYGMDDVYDFAINDQRTLAMLEFARKAGLQFCLCYEDWTIQAAIDTGFILEADAIAHAQQTLLYAQSNYFNDPSYLRLTNGQPVLLNFGPQYFHAAGQWAAIFSPLDSTNAPSFFTLNNRLSVGAGAFNWPPMYLSQTNGGILAPQALESYLDNFEQKGGTWPAYISSAFPRFHDIYQQAGVGSSYGFLDDDDGATFRSTLARAMTNDSAMIQLVTWNDFGEGTIIEPTVEYGHRDLGVVQDLCRQYFDPGFACQTNDLLLATRVYDLRRQHAANPVLAAELDRIFQDIVSGDLQLADLRLTGMEANQPVIYDVGVSNNTLQFSVGGYVSQSGADVQTTSNLVASWEAAGPLTVGTNSIEFTTPILEQGAAAFFRVRTAEP